MQNPPFDRLGAFVALSCPPVLPPRQNGTFCAKTKVYAPLVNPLLTLWDFSAFCLIRPVLPKRWIVERTIGWLGRCRRLAKDWENLNHNALAFLRLASIRLMLRKLCNPS